MPQIISRGEMLKSLLDFVHEIDPKKLLSVEINLENNMVEDSSIRTGPRQFDSKGQDITIKIRLSA